MKRNYIGVLVSVMILGFFACSQTPAPQIANGKVFDATMNNVTIITTTGDTLNISTMDKDTAKIHSVMVDDSVKIVYKKEKMNEAEILKAIELSVTAHSPYFYIAGTWLEPNPINAAAKQGVTLNTDGSASSVNMATLLFKSWVLNNGELMLAYESIGNGQTLTGIDTLQVVKLNADSLVLANKGDIVWRFARQK